METSAPTTITSTLNFSAFYAKDNVNEPHMLALLQKIKDVVNTTNGKYCEKWNDHKSNWQVSIEIELPDQRDKSLVDEVNGYLNAIDALNDENSIKDSCNGQPNFNEHEIDQPENKKAVAEDSNSESLFSDRSSDESWAPSDEKEKLCVSQILLEELQAVNNPPLKKRKVASESVSQKTKKAKTDRSTKKCSEKKEEEPDKDNQPPQKRRLATERRKISCPLVACKANVVHLPRHMRTVHHWTKEAASKVMLKYNIRKRKDNTAKKKDYHTRRRCRVSDCHSVVKRLSAHLQKVHKLNKTSKEYIDAMQNAVVVPDHKHPMILWQEERLQTKKWLVKVKSKPSDSLENDASIDRQKEDNEFPLDDNASTGSDSDVKSNSNSDPTSENPSAGEIRSDVGMPTLLVAFEDWLRSPDGGKRDEKTVKQHSTQLFGMLKAIDEAEDVKSLLDLKLLRHIFLKSYVKNKNYEAGTIKSYLMSLRHFYSFLISDRPEGIQFNVQDVSAAQEKVKNWSVSYKRESNTRKWQKLEEDTMNRLTPSNIRTFEKSDTAREAIKIIGKHSDTTQTTVLTQQSYTLVRDFLFTQIFIDNANRPGVLAGMTMQEYRRMSKHNEHYIITVMEHKTAYVHGPARIVLSSKLKSWLTVFVELMRPQIASATTGNVFLSWNGNKMKSGHITKAVQSVFKKGGMDVKVTSTSFRKAAVTKVHTDDPSFSGKLARHMAHNEATAKKYYLLAEKSKESVEASKKLGELMRCDGTEENETGCNTKSPECPSVTKGNQKVPWNEQDLKKIKDSFEKEIAAKKITIDMVRDRIERSEELRGMSPRRVYDKLKKEISKKSSSSAALLELPQDRDTLEDKLSRFDATNESTSVGDQLSTSIIAPSERNSNFTNDELTDLHKLFRDMITENRTICHIEIKKRCSASQEGQKLLKKLPVQKILNRIKYERRKKRLSSQ